MPLSLLLCASSQTVGHRNISCPLTSHPFTLRCVRVTLETVELMLGWESKSQSLSPRHDPRNGPLTVPTPRALTSTRSTPPPLLSSHHQADRLESAAFVYKQRGPRHAHNLQRLLASRFLPEGNLSITSACRGQVALSDLFRYSICALTLN